MATKLTKAQYDAIELHALNQQIGDAIMEAEKSRPAVSVEVNGNMLDFTFGDGSTMQFDCVGQSVEISKRALMHGFEQKLRDAAALPTKTIGGRVFRPTVAEKKAEVIAMAAQLQSGVWNAGRESSGPSGGALFEAFNEAFPGKFADLEAFNAKIAERAATPGVDGPIGEATVRKTLAAIPAVAAIIARNRAAKKSDGTDGDNVLDAFLQS